MHLFEPHCFYYLSLLWRSAYVVPVCGLLCVHPLLDLEVLDLHGGVPLRQPWRVVRVVLIVPELGAGA